MEYVPGDIILMMLFSNCFQVQAAFEIFSHSKTFKWFQDFANLSLTGYIIIIFIILIILFQCITEKHNSHVASSSFTFEEAIEVKFSINFKFTIEHEFYNAQDLKPFGLS